MLQFTLKPANIPIAAKFIAVLGKYADRLEAKTLVQRRRGSIRRDISGDDAMNVLPGQSLKQRCVELAANSTSQIVGAIDGRFDSCAVSGLGLNRVVPA